MNLNSLNIWITIDILFELITNLHFIIISATKETRREGEVKKPPKVYKNVLDRFKQWTQIPSSTWAEPCYFFSFFQMTKMRLLTNKDNLNSLKIQLAAELAGQKLEVVDITGKSKLEYLTLQVSCHH